MLLNTLFSISILYLSLQPISCIEQIGDRVVLRTLKAPNPAQQQQQQTGKQEPPAAAAPAGGAPVAAPQGVQNAPAGNPAPAPAPAANAVPAPAMPAVRPAPAAMPAPAPAAVPAPAPAMPAGNPAPAVPAPNPAPRVPAPSQPEEISALTILAEHPSCAQDVKRLCPPSQAEGKDTQQSKVQHNFEVLECFMSITGDDKPPSTNCQTIVTKYKYMITKDERFEDAAKEVCKDFIKNNGIESQCTTKEKGAFLACVIEHAYEVEEEENQEHDPCYQFLNKMEMIIFSDYHLVHDFLHECMSDIQKHDCGRIYPKKPDEEDIVNQHNQGATIDCLQQKFQNLKPTCQNEIAKVSELQADDYHLDRPLYFACKHDKEKFCKSVKSGQGQVYQCLMENQKDKAMSEGCRNELIKREKLMQEDIKVDKSFYLACKDVLKKYDCPTEPIHPHEHISMSKTIMCIRDKELTIKDDTKSIMTNECMREIRGFQELLLTDYKINAEIVSDCHTEIEQHCEGLQKADKEDGTVHCLMRLAMPSDDEDGKKEKFNARPRLNDKCLESLRELVEETNPEKSNSVDQYLMNECVREIQQFCPNDPNPFGCLVNQIREGKMTHDVPCAKHLMELEYFIKRNYKQDEKLYKACDADVKAHNLEHNLPKDSSGPKADAMVIGQLWKLVRDQVIYQQQHEKPISEQCVMELLRVVHERAVSIDLNPELEQACMNVLSKYCGNAPAGEELGCLAEHYDDIGQSEMECKKALEEYIKDEDADYQLDYIIMKSCEPAMKKYCGDVLNTVEQGNVDQGAIVQCLIENKHAPDMDPKCFAGIEHHQLVNMQNYNFNTQFREACKADYEAHCKHKTNRVDVIICLADIARNDTLLDKQHRLSDKCRRQLTVESLQWEETDHLDPHFKKVCGKAVEQLCPDVKPAADDDGESILVCLRRQGLERVAQVQRECAAYLHQQVQDNNMLAGAGAAVYRYCKHDIKKHCSNRDPEELMECLDENYDLLSKRCKKVLNEEEEQDNEDIRLNPALYLPCKDDIHKFCSEVLEQHKDQDSLQGQVINCLKYEYVKGKRSKLSDSCANQMHLLVVKVQNRDYKQDFVLTHECKRQIKDCIKQNKKHSEDTVVECLKEKLFNGELKDDIQCQQEVFRLITENRVDIQTDHELYETCRVEIASSPCGNIPAGGGRVMSCLLALYDAGHIKDPHCRETVKKRTELWSKAAKLSPPESLQEVWNDITTSNSRWYFLSIIAAVILVILIIGIFCGRFTKRVASEIKNR